MSTVNFSVPEKVKRKFNAAFSGKNKSQAIARLMIRAVEEEEKARRRKAAIDLLVKMRRHMRITSDREVRGARRKGRP